MNLPIDPTRLDEIPAGTCPGDQQHRHTPTLTVNAGFVSKSGLTRHLDAQGRPGKVLYG